MQFLFSAELAKVLGGGNIIVMSRIQLVHKFDDIISLENLLGAWQEFVRGKRQRRDVQAFEVRLVEKIITLHNDLAAKKYQHSAYEAFTITDPKPRNIHKATVRDRVLHHAVYRVLYPFFERTFVADSYSCQNNKGTHKALKRFREFSRKAGENNKKTCWILKGDIRKFFASIDQRILLDILAPYIADADVLWLLDRIIGSFYSTEPGKGLPLGNLTSQLLVNIYLNEFDRFVKQKLRVKYYIRYADDFVIFSQNKGYLEKLIPQIENFLEERLSLMLHPNKVSIETLNSGVDFLGWVHFPDHHVLRTVTKRRMLKRLQNNSEPAVVASYLGLLSHGNTIKLQNEVYKIGKIKAVDANILLC